MEPQEITTKTHVGQVMRIPELRAAAPCFFGGNSLLRFFISLSTPEAEHRFNPSSNPESLAAGMRRLAAVAKENKHYLLDVYSPEEIQRDKSLSDVKLIHFPGEPENPFVLVCAGGGFTCVASHSEAFPVSAGLNELGYTAFVLNYRIDRSGKKRAADLALKDVAAALRYILRHKKELSLHSEGYAVAGCSAGGYLTVLWGTAEHGYLKYDLPKPKALFPVYPFVSPTLWPDNGRDPVLTRILGKNYTNGDKRFWDPLQSMDENYPPCFINCCKDDNVVSYIHSERLVQELEKNGVPCELLLGEYGGHGYGDGRGTDAEEWIDKATAFLQNL